MSIGASLARPAARIQTTGEQPHLQAAVRLQVRHRAKARTLGPLCGIIGKISNQFVKDSVSATAMRKVLNH